jgi:ankyrin repeat protein
LTADHELERKLSALRGLLLETTPSYTINVVGTNDSAPSSTDHDDDADSRVEDAEAQNHLHNETSIHPVLSSDNTDSASDSGEDGEDDEYDGEEDENGAEPLWLAAAHGDAARVATLLKQGDATSINLSMGASNKESAASSSTSPLNAQYPPRPPAADSTDRKDDARKRSTPLAAASARGHTAVVQVLLAAAMAELGAGSGAEGSGEALGSSSDDGGGNFAAFVDAPNAQGSTSLLLAAARGWHEVSII